MSAKIQVDPPGAAGYAKIAFKILYRIVIVPFHSEYAIACSGSVALTIFSHVDMCLDSSCHLINTSSRTFRLESLQVCLSCKGFRNRTLEVDSPELLSNFSLTVKHLKKSRTVAVDSPVFVEVC